MVRFEHEALIELLTSLGGLIAIFGRIKAKDRIG